LNPQGKNLKLFGLRSGEGEFLGGLVIKFFPWERLKDQLFFSPRISQDGTIEELSVQSISSLVEKNFKIPKKINLGIYLSFFAVHEVHRKKGLGRDLFERYIKEVEENPQEGKLAFTIILGKHSFFPLGETLMQNMLGKKPRRSTEERDFQELKTLYHLPEDLFQTDPRSAATKALVKERGFTFLGFSKFLGELWGKIF
jgi:GNAT superfamily N-acetyltransferase